MRLGCNGRDRMRMQWLWRQRGRLDWETMFGDSGDKFEVGLQTFQKGNGWIVSARSVVIENSGNESMILGQGAVDGFAHGGCLRSCS